MKVFNKKYRRYYKEIKAYETGIVLTGAEVKSVKSGRIKLDNAFVKIIGNEVFLLNAEIPIYKFACPENYDLRRTRKLLLHKKQIIKLQIKLKSGGRLTIVPISCYNKDGLIKLKIGLVRGRGEIERKKLDKQKRIKRELDKEVKEYLKK